MKIVFLGATKFSFEILDALISRNFKPGMVFGIPEYFKISYATEPVKNYNFRDLRLLSEKHGIAYHTVDGSIGKGLKDYYEAISLYQPDLILVMGWYYKVNRSIRVLAKHGAWGIHASLLPDYAGGAPLVWAIINGETETGVTLFALDDGIDTGDIVGQRGFAIGKDDTIADVYEKATEFSKELLCDSLQNIASIHPSKQDVSRRRVFPQRTPDDGRLDLSWPAKRMHDFVRAQSAPYPGAFIETSDGRKLVIEKTRVSGDEN